MSQNGLVFWIAWIASIYQIKLKILRFFVKNISNSKTQNTKKIFGKNISNSKTQNTHNLY
jgi:hypothetical protein